MSINYKSLLQVAKKYKNLDFLDEMTESYPELTPRNHKELKYFSKSKLKGMQELALSLKDANEIEIESAIIGLWFEYRSEWIRHNAVNNFKMFTEGNAEALHIVQSAILSHLTKEIEEFISPEKLSAIHETMVKIQNAGLS